MSVTARPQDEATVSRSPKRLRNGLLRWAAALLLLIGAGFTAGFIVFAHHVSTVARLAPVLPGNADGIVVLTGGPERVGDALKLLEDQHGKRLLITGVHPRVTPDTLAQLTGADGDLFRCCVDIDRAAQNTLGNAVETARWARANDFQKLIVVTSAYHMPRAVLELRRMLPEAQFFPWAVVTKPRNLDSWWQNYGTTRLLANEFTKYLLAHIHIRLGTATLNRAALNPAPTNI